MLSAMKRRYAERCDEEREGGFTLIELMVVVLIIAILLAIAIPTFLGARARAQDRAAQSNLRNALTASKTLYTDTQNYNNVNAAGLKGIEPSLTYNDGASSAVGTVGVTASADGGNSQGVALSGLSATGTCWYLVDVAASTDALVGKNNISGPGTWYASGAGPTCTTSTLGAGLTFKQNSF